MTDPKTRKSQSTDKTAKRKIKAKAAAKRKPAKQPELIVPKQELQLRTSERSNFKRCRWLWDRTYNDQLKPIQEAPALRFGTLIHAALEARYPKGVKRGPKPAETFEQLYHQQVKDAYDKWGFRDEEGDWDDALGLGIDMMEAFVDHYGKDEDWQVLASEMTFQVPVFDGEEYVFTYVGTMDGVWKNRMDGGVRVIDWKTTKNDPTKVSHLILDEQATAYWTWGCDALIRDGLLKPREREALDGMLYTFLRKAKRDERPRNAQGACLNKDGSVSQKQPSPFFHREVIYRSEHDRNEARQRAIQEVREMKMVRAGELAAYKTPGSGPMSHCSWCPMKDICELHEVGADWEGLRDATMTTWDPYAAHEIEGEGR